MRLLWIAIVVALVCLALRQFVPGSVYTGSAIAILLGLVVWIIGLLSRGRA